MRKFSPFFKLFDLRFVLKITVSFITGVLFYGVWLAVFLWLDPQVEWLETMLWITAPFATGIGFGLGVYTLNTVDSEDQGSFRRIIIWPIAGCIFGALVVYWFGPMLIVFSMLVAGVVSIAAREVLLLWQNRIDS
jgi:hypothetical protein